MKKIKKRDFKYFCKEIQKDIKLFNVNLILKNDKAAEVYDIEFTGLRKAFRTLFNCYSKTVHNNNGEIEKVIFVENGTGKLIKVIKAM